ncbi:hypothetical protein ACH498_25025 [Rhodococcus erythropolis]
MTGAADADRYHWTYNRQTGELVGMLDTAFTPPARSAASPRRAPMPRAYGAGPTVQLPAKTLMVVLALATAFGAYAALLLFGDRGADRTVVVCPAPGVQVAVRPVECGPQPEQAAAR